MLSARLSGPLLAAFIACALPAPAGQAAEIVGPAITASFGPDGRLWRALPRDAWLEVDYSADQGGTFSPPVRVNARKQRVRAAPEDRPQIALDSGGRVFVTWAADARQPWTRYFAWSGDGGRSFSAAVPVSDAADRALQYQTVVQPLGNGAAQVFWSDARNEARNGPGIGSMFSATFGPQNWTTPNSVAIAETICECCRFAVAAAPGGGALIFARLVIDGAVRDLGLVTVATDAKANVRRVTSDDWRINACPEHGPALAVGPGNRYHLAWFTLGTQRKGLFYAHTDDGGQQLSPPVPIGDPSRLPGHGSVAAAGANVALAWQEFDGRRTYVRAMLSADNGETWGEPREMASSPTRADYPFVLTDGSTLFVSWYAEDLGYRLYPLAARDTP